MKSKAIPSYAGRCRFVVELYDITGAQDFSLAQELISQGLGAPGEDSDLIVSTEPPYYGSIKSCLVKLQGRYHQENIMSEGNKVMSKNKVKWYWHSHKSHEISLFLDYHLFFNFFNFAKWPSQDFNCPGYRSAVSAFEKFPSHSCMIVDIYTSYRPDTGNCTFSLQSLIVCVACSMRQCSV